MNINATLIGQSIAFAVFVWFCMKYVWPPMMTTLENRKKDIADGLAAAARGKQDLELAQHKATERLHESRVEARRSLILPTNGLTRLLMKLKNRHGLKVNASGWLPGLRLTRK